MFNWSGISIVKISVRTGFGGDLNWWAHIKLLALKGHFESDTWMR